MKIQLILCILLLQAIHVIGQNQPRDIDFNQLSLPFKEASSELQPQYIPYLYLLADSLKSNDRLHVLIRGHVCCSRKNKLAKKRAKTIKNYLLHFGVSPLQIETRGMRNTMPLVFPEKNEADELANMRVDFVLSEKK